MNECSVSMHTDGHTHLIFRVREGRLLHSFIEGHDVCQTLVPVEEIGSYSSVIGQGQ